MKVNIQLEEIEGWEEDLDLVDKKIRLTEKSCQNHKVFMWRIKGGEIRARRFLQEMIQEIPKKGRSG